MKKLPAQPTAHHGSVPVAEASARVEPEVRGRDVKRFAETERIAAWKSENRGAIEALTVWVDEHGLPLERYRQF
jgi:hypothetical protein